MIDYKQISDNLKLRSSIYDILRSDKITLETTLDEFKERKDLITTARRLENDIYTYKNIMQALVDFEKSKILYIITDNDERFEYLTCGKNSPNYANFCFRIDSHNKESDI